MINYVYQYVKFKSTGNFRLPDNSVVDEFILCTQQPDLAYGSSDRKILNKNLTIGDIRYQINRTGVQQVQNTTITFSNVGQFYHSMRELNGDDFWNTLNISIYWADGRVPTLMFDGADWLEDGETIVSFTPIIPYPLTTDYIKKEFEGSLASATESKEKVSLSLVSKSKQDAYLIGSIQSFNGSDSSRSLISPILLGDLTDDNAFVPMLLVNPIATKSTAICSDISLSTAPIPYIYDDENERFHQVVNEQTATNNNKQIEFYDVTESNQFDVESDFVEQTKDVEVEDAPILNTLTSGEVVAYFTDDKDFVIFNDYNDPAEYNIESTTNRLRDEGVRDFNNNGSYTDGEYTGYLVDSFMAEGIAQVNLSLYPTNLKNVDPLGDNITLENAPSFLNFKQNPGGADDFETFGYSGVGPNEPGYFSSYKNVIDFKGVTPNTTRALPNYENGSESLWLAAHARNDTPIASTWPDYNYTNKIRVGLSADFDQFKFDSDVRDGTFYFYGAVYTGFTQSSDSNAYGMGFPGGSPYRSLVSLSYIATYLEPSLPPFEVSTNIHDYNSSVEGIFNLNGTQSLLYKKLSDFYENPPQVNFNGYTAYNPVKNSNPIQDPPIAANSYLDRVDPSFFGSSRFAMDGMRADINVNARVESKYWCFKGISADNLDLETGLNQLATRYNSTPFSSVGVGRSDWKVAGVHVGDPIYYRDLLAQITEEFRVFTTDRNGLSELVPMGLSSDAVYTIDESKIKNAME